MTTPTRTNRVLQITTRIVDRMGPTLRALRLAFRTLRRIGVATFRAIGTAARFAGRAIRALLGPIGLVTAALGGFGITRLIRTAADVEDRVREIGTLLPGIAEEALDDLSDRIRRAAIEGGQAFEDEFRAAYDSISAGVPADNLIEFLGTANRLAIGGATDVASATDLLTGSLNAFGKSADEAERFADALFTTVRQGKTTITELAQGMGQVASTAGSAGLTIEQTGAALAAITLVTGDTNLAATQLRAALSALASVTPQQEAAARALGAEYSLLALRTMGLVEFIDQLNTAVDGDIIRLREFVPNIRAVAGFLNLAANDTQNLRDAMAEMGQNVGAAQQAFDLAAASAGTSFRRLRAAIADVAVEIGDAFLPLLSELADDLRAFLADNREGLRAWAEDFVATLRRIGNAVVPFLELVRGLFDPANAAQLGAIIRGAGTAIGRSLIDVGGRILTALRDTVVNNLETIGRVFKLVGAAAAKGILEGLAEVGFRLEQSGEGTIERTLGGFLRRAAETAASVSRNAISDVLEAENVTGADTLLGKLTQALVEGAGANLDIALEGIAGGFGDVTANVRDFLGTVRDQPLVETFLDAATALEQAEEATITFAQAFPLLDRLFKIAEQARRNVENAAKGAQAAVPQFRAFRDSLAQLVEGFQAGAAAFVEQIEQPFQAGVRLFADLASAASDAWNSAINDAVNGVFELEDSLDRLGRRALAIFAQIASQQTALAITRFFFPTFGFAQGGIPPGPLQFGAFANGGITSSPMLALIGEGQRREAIVPLPDGRSIPVTMTGGGGSEEPAVQVNVNINAIDARGFREVLSEEGDTIRNLVAEGVRSQRQFRSIIRGG